MPKLSIVIPVYNAQTYLHECVDSVLHSSFSDFELILVDDGSRDLSPQICDEYSCQDSRVVVVHQTNGGVSKARNRGIDIAQGEWITFVDADDKVTPSFYSNLMEAVSSHASMDFLQAGCTNLRGNEIGAVEQEYSYRNSDDKGYLFSHFRGLTFSKLFKNAILKNYHICFDEMLCSEEDMIFTLDYINYVDRYVFSEECGYLYRRDNDSSLTHTLSPKPYSLSLHSFLHRYKAIQAFLAKYQINETDKPLRNHQLCEELTFTIYQLYREESNRGKRIHCLKSDFSSNQLQYLRFAEGKTDWLCFIFLRNGFFLIFDLIFSFMLNGYGRYLR